MTAPQVFIFQRDLLLTALTTITSPVFCEFVLELGGLSPHLNRRYSMHWGPWHKIDEFLEDRFAKRRDFRLTIRTGEPGDKEGFQRHARETFLLLESRGCVHFETSNSIEKHWR
jgi:hypothetical protein